MAAPSVAKRVLLLSAAATGTSQYIDISNYVDPVLFFQTNGTPSAGTVLIEEALWMPDALPWGGTWSLIDTITYSDIGNSSQTAYHPGGPGGQFGYGYIRVRIGTAWVGTTLTVILGGV